MTKEALQPQDKYVLRLPDGMRDRLKAAAAGAGRSMNAEIVARLEDSFNNWPKLRLSKEMQARAAAADLETKSHYDHKLNEMVEQTFDYYFPPPNFYRDKLISSFGAILGLEEGLTQARRDELQKGFLQHVNEFLKSNKLDGSE